MGLNNELEIARQAAEIKLDDMSGTLTIDAAIEQVQRNLNKISAFHEIIKNVRGEYDD